MRIFPALLMEALHLGESCQRATSRPMRSSRGLPAWNLKDDSPVPRCEALSKLLNLFLTQFSPLKLMIKIPL